MDVVSGEEMAEQDGKVKDKARRRVRKAISMGPAREMWISRMFILWSAKKP